MKVKIQIYDHVHCRIEKEKRYLLDPILRHKYRIWLAGQFKKYPKDVDKTFVTSGGLFLTGFLPMVKKYLCKQGVKVKIKGTLERLKQENDPKINNITFKEEQKLAIKKAIKKQRGVIQFPTATGKTVIAGGIVSCFNVPRVLFLCRQNSILRQTRKKFESYGFKDIGLYGDGEKKFGRITIATAQSLINVDPEEYMSRFDIVIVDEAHEVSGSSQHQKILERCLAPVRIGLTATPYTEKIKKLFMIGHLGPIIARLTMKKAIEKKLLAKPVVELEIVKRSRDIADECFVYRKVKKDKNEKIEYGAEHHGIIHNYQRNKLVLLAAQRSVAKNRSVLIMVRRISHGRNLLVLANMMHFIGGIKFVRGDTDSETRELVAKLLHQKKYKCVIASSIWKQGIDIPSLNHIINAFGGVGDIPTIQVSGRGTRTDDGKKEYVLLTDFLDPYRYLAEHTVRRIQIYREQGWM